MIKRSNKVECYTIEEVQMIFIKKSHATSFMKYLDEYWTRCAKCRLTFKNRDDKHVICSPECERRRGKPY